MPLLASIIGAIASGVVAVLSRIMAYQYALKLASYTAWITVFTAFLLAVYSCMRFLMNTVQAIFTYGGGTGTLALIKQGFGMGLGMLIPSNAGSVMGCIASVWIACQIYKIQRDGIHNYSK